MTRHRMLLVAFCTTGLIAAAGCLWLIDANRWIDAREARPLPMTTSPILPQNQKFVSFYAVGDTGAETAQRRAVIKQMAVRAPRDQPQFIMLLGDNFYKRGVTSVADPKWRSEFEHPFADPRLACDFFVALGNHDHLGNFQAEIDYSRVNTRWNMPDAYYSFERSAPDGVTVAFFVLDTNPLHFDPDSQATQVRWFRDTLAASTADWKIVAGHHPILSGGHHGPSDNVAVILEPIFEEFGVDVYMSGHDHDLQLLDSNRGWLQLVSGAGSSIRPVHWTDSTLFAEATGGFAWVLVTPDELSIEIISAAGHRFTHRIVKTPARFRP